MAGVIGTRLTSGFFSALGAGAAGAAGAGASGPSKSQPEARTTRARERRENPHSRKGFVSMASTAKPCGSMSAGRIGTFFCILPKWAAKRERKSAPLHGGRSHTETLLPPEEPSDKHSSDGVILHHHLTRKPSDPVGSICSICLGGVV